MQQTQQMLQIDTIYKKVEVIDTVYTKVNVVINDTIYNTIEPELMQVYQGLLTSQDNKFDNLLWAIGICVTVLLVGFGVFNLVMHRPIFRKDAKKVFKEEKLKFQKDLEKIRSEFDISNRAVLHTARAHAVGTHWEVSDYQYVSIMHFLNSISLWANTFHKGELLNVLEFCNSVAENIISNKWQNDDWLQSWGAHEDYINDIKEKCNFPEEVGKLKSNLDKINVINNK